MQSACVHFIRPGTVLRGPTLQMMVYGSVLIMMLILVYRYTQPSPVHHLQYIGAIAALKESLSRIIKEELARKNSNVKIPTIYIITPTYRRQEQIPELTRFAQTLMHVPNIHWIVADDANVTNRQVVEYLTYTGISHTYLLTPMPEKYKSSSIKPKGVANRNGGLQWVREHATTGVVYFADDDNTYDIRVFQEMRYTERVSMWPVGLVTKAGLSTPVLKNGKFFSWYDGWIASRKFPIDMAGFAVSVQYLLKVPDAAMPYKAGYEEDGFMKSLKIRPEEIEFKAEECTKIYVWHTQTKKNGPSNKDILDSKYNDTNLRILQKRMMIAP
ncbi:galactosylgalactosylxylosylprotein 3-beta-glucuronosyltransferase P isoform X3 [Procambarus clarkii]|uniref:galactosylgalactosylxylosylprotein 3-beta-glucuronosyltransferase P isoform X3 n=1 Tax=Procambarus clarkii TaxID=6728 RepID=UPI001E676A29|nr:galactosylgalactosylxylosylprotein 3-beta-glucuronosyltransferase P-like isoform X3 [Procambarus clarkii]